MAKGIDKYLFQLCREKLDFKGLLHPRLFFFPSGLIKITLKDNVGGLPQFFKEQDFNFDDQTVLK